MKQFLYPLLVLITWGSSVNLNAQNSQTAITALRAASNQALKSYDHEKVLSILTEDVLTTTGAGTLLSGKQALRSYIAGAPKSKMYWVRTPTEIRINETEGLAWETGVWKGYNPPTGEAPVVGGNYSAMWKREKEGWKIASQLFVSLE